MESLFDLPKEIVSVILEQFIDKNYKLLIISLTSRQLSKYAPGRRNDEIMEDMAIDGNLSLLQWGRRLGFGLNREVGYYAAKGAHLDILGWLWNINHFPDKLTFVYSVSSTSSQKMKVLKWLKDNNCPWDESVFYYAALEGDMEVIQWLKDNDCPWNEQTCSYAALKGHFEVLQWVRSNGCPWNEEACSFAASGGHLEIIKWLRNNGCPWDEETCRNAAKKGHLEVLKWVRENSCPWNEGSCSAAAAGGQLKILKWLRENGCPWNVGTCYEAISNNHLDILQWAKDNGWESLEWDNK